MRLLCIADGGPTIGHGHWVRALAVAEHALARGHQVTLVARQVDPRPPTAWTAAPCPVRIVPSYDQLPDADLLVVDSYREAGIVAARAARMVAYDDVGLLAAPGCQAVVNPNLGAERFAYPGIPQQLLGHRFATIRHAFRRIRRIRAGAVRFIMLGLGGTGNGSAWVTIKPALRPVTRQGTVQVLLYGTRLHPVDWYRSELGTAQVTAIEDNQTAWEAFLRADLAIVGLGVTALECLCVGIPTVVYSASENQRPLIPLWRSSGFPTLARDTLPLWVRDETSRMHLSQQGMDVVDGHGAGRVLEAVTR